MIMNTPTPIETHAHAAVVQLIVRHGDIPAGAPGRILGRYARENPTYVVSFGVKGVIELRGDEIIASAA